MPRLLKPAVVGVLLVLVAASPALGKGPTKEPYPTDPISFGAGEVCQFPIIIDTLDSRAHVLSWPEDANGVSLQRVGGYYQNRVTNDATGASVTFKSNGPATFTMYPDGSLDIFARGESLLWFYPGEPYEGLLLTHGYYRAHLSADDVITEADIRGPITDVCAMLAG